MKKIRKTIGTILIASPFAIYFAFLFQEHGWSGVLIVAASLLVFLGVTYLGVKLLIDD